MPLKCAELSICQDLSHSKSRHIFNGQKRMEKHLSSSTSLCRETETWLLLTPGFPGRFPIQMLTRLDLTESMRSDKGTAEGGRTAVN